MTDKKPYERALDKSEAISRMKHLARTQLNGSLDSTRARAHWECFLASCFESGYAEAELAEAITRGISEAAFELGLTRSY